MTGFDLTLGSGEIKSKKYVRSTILHCTLSLQKQYEEILRELGFVIEETTDESEIYSGHNLDIVNYLKSHQGDFLKKNSFEF